MANAVTIKSPMYLQVFTNNAGEEKQEDRILVSVFRPKHYDVENGKVGQGGQRPKQLSRR